MLPALTLSKMLNILARILRENFLFSFSNVPSNSARTLFIMFSMKSRGLSVSSSSDLPCSNCENLGNVKTCENLCKRNVYFIIFFVFRLGNVFHYLFSFLRKESSKFLVHVRTRVPRVLGIFYLKVIGC